MQLVHANVSLNKNSEKIRQEIKKTYNYKNLNLQNTQIDYEELFTLVYKLEDFSRTWEAHKS